MKQITRKKIQDFDSSQLFYMVRDKLLDKGFFKTSRIKEDGNHVNYLSNSVGLEKDFGHSRVCWMLRSYITGEFCLGINFDFRTTEEDRIDYDSIMDVRTTQGCHGIFMKNTEKIIKEIEEKLKSKEWKIISFVERNELQSDFYIKYDFSDIFNSKCLDRDFKYEVISKQIASDFIVFSNIVEPYLEKMNQYIAIL